MSYRICNFPKPGGFPCGSPTLRGKKLCFYHQRDFSRQQNVSSAIRRADILGPRLPPMRSLKDTQVALNEVMQALAAGSVPLSRAGRILFDLQQATLALRKPRPSLE